MYKKQERLLVFLLLVIALILGLSLMTQLFE